MSYKYLFPLKLSLSSLLQKEFAARLPADVDTEYYDFLTGTTQTLTLSLPAIRKFFEYPVQLSSSFPYLVIHTEPSTFPEQIPQAREEHHKIEIAIYDKTSEIDLLHKRLEIYCGIASNILLENIGELRKRQLMWDMKILTHDFGFFYKEGAAAFIRSIRIPVLFKTIE